MRYEDGPSLQSGFEMSIRAETLNSNLGLDPSDKLYGLKPNPQFRLDPFVVSIEGLNPNPSFG